MKNQEHEAESLSAVIRPWRLRLALKGALKWAMLGSGVGLGLAVVLLAAARLVPWPDVFLWGIVATVAGTTAGVSYGVLGRPSREAAARRADHLLGLSDRLGTAWELRNSGSPFAALQRQDALASAGALEPGEAINMWPVRSHFLPLLVGLVLIGLLVVLPNPMDGIIRQQEHFQEQLAQVEEELLKTKEDVVGPDTSLSAEERAAAEEALEKLQEALTETKDIPSALAALSDAEQEIGSLQEPKIGDSRELRDVGAILAKSPMTRALGQALHSMDGAALLDAMDALAARLNSMSEDELQELASSLQRAANSSTGKEALAGSLRQASRTIASGDPRTAAATLGDLADRLASLQEAVKMRKERTASAWTWPGPSLLFRRFALRFRVAVEHQIEAPGDAARQRHNGQIVEPLGLPSPEPPPHSGLRHAEKLGQLLRRQLGHLQQAFQPHPEVLGKRGSSLLPGAPFTSLDSHDATSSLL